MRNQSSPKFVFADQDGNSLKVDHYSGREFRTALNRAGLNRIRFHDLRHTYASNFMMNGGNLYDLQKILGHTKSDTTNIYAHLSPAHLSNAVKIVNFSFDEVKTEHSPYLALAGESS
jgi:site-specific recombinase XerD